VRAWSDSTISSPPDLGDTAQRSGDIADRLEVKVQSIAPVRNGLIKKGMIYSPAHGDTAFTVTGPALSNLDDTIVVYRLIIV
jgi:hypothetical protein